MMPRTGIIVAAVLAMLAMPAIAAEAPPAGRGNDLLDRAQAYVEKSDRYLHHSRLSRGMKGYGLTVFEGASITRFEVEIVSVMTHWGPQQDVILARLATNGLESSGVIAGMSGSPVFVTDPSDGKDKIIGAVAYGYYFQKEPLCGLQPITQMLAGSGMFNGKHEGEGAAAPAGAKASGGASDTYLQAVLGPKKIDFATFDWSGRPKPQQEGQAELATRLSALRTPLMISGLSKASLSQAGSLLSPLGIMPVQAGGVGVAQARALGEVKLEPGAAVSVPLVTGDSDFSAVGTVTDVIDDRVLAFGHSMFGQGEVSLPMGPAYVHAVISSVMSSFKLSSSLGVVGCLTRDEEVGVSGLVGQKPVMVPLSINVQWKNKGTRQSFEYEVVRHRFLTPVLVRLMIYDACRGWHELPEQHVVRHSVQVDFGKLGKYTAANVSSDMDVWDVISDVTRPIGALLNNPFGPPPELERIAIDISVDSGRRRADILDFKLDGKTFRPGEKVTGALILRPYRQDRQALPVDFQLPADLPEGTYWLTVCDWSVAASAQAGENPHRYAPRTVTELFDALQRIVQPQCNELHLRLKLNRGGVAVGTTELPDLPASKLRLLAEAARLDTRIYNDAVVRTIPTDYVLYGCAGAEFSVEARPSETTVRGSAAR